MQLMRKTFDEFDCIRYECKIATVCVIVSCSERLRPHSPDREDESDNGMFIVDYMYSSHIH